MKITSETISKYMILLVTLSQFLNVSCSRGLYPEPSFQHTETRAEKQKLKDFMDGGIEKELDTHHTGAEEIIATAREFIGVPHCMGGTTRKCMDCSGLLVAVFAKYDIHLPHNSEEQARYGKIVTETGDLKEGDLVFFIESYNTRHFITHSGIYTGNNAFIHTSSKKGVTITSLDDPWWKGKFIFGTRVLE